MKTKTGHRGWTAVAGEKVVRGIGKEILGLGGSHVPGGGNPRIFLKFDVEAYSGYNSPEKI